MKFQSQNHHFNGGWGVVEFDILADTRVGLESALRIAISEHHRATHYQVSEVHDGALRLELMWSTGSKGIPLPFPLEDASQMTDFVTHWLAANGKWPDRVPDTDGSTHRGFRITSNDDGWAYTLAFITPEWTVYGK